MDDRTSAHGNLSPAASPMENSKTASEMRNLLAHRVFHWNQMRKTMLSYNAVPDSKYNKDILSERTDVPAEMEQDILNAFKSWIIDDVYWYMRESVNSMGIGIYVHIRFSEHDRTEITRSNNALNITIAPYLCLLAHTPAIYDLKDVEKAQQFYTELVDDLYTALSQDGYTISARDSWERPIKASDAVLEGMRDTGYVRLTIQWADEELAAGLEQLEYESQIDAFDAGVPLEDILA